MCYFLHFSSPYHSSSTVAMTLVRKAVGTLMFVGQTRDKAHSPCISEKDSKKL